MTRQEFEDIAKERVYEVQITNDDYSAIERATSSTRASARRTRSGRSLISPDFTA